MDIHFRDFKRYTDEEKQIFDVYPDIEGLHWLVSDAGCWSGPLKNWRKEYLQWLEHVKKFDTVVQAGGACGMYPRFYAEHFANVITFEPDDNNHRCLLKNCTGIQYTIYKGALGNTTDKRRLRNNNTLNVGMHTIREEPGDTQMYRIDDLNLKKCDLIHLDVERYETPAILGAAKTIEKFKPVVITERGGGREELAQMGYTRIFKGEMDSIFVSHE